MSGVIEPLSQCAYRVRSNFGSTELATATCFFVKTTVGRVFLVTNWHVVTGKNNETGKHLDSHCGEPDRLYVDVFLEQEYLECSSIEILLLDEAGAPRWLEHPKFGSQVDVVALEVLIPEGKSIIPIDSMIEPFNEDTQVRVKNDVFIVGFPFGLRTGEILPIWKRASVASEPVVDVDELPKILVDTASRPGMSGSPVIFFERRPVAIADRKPDEQGATVSHNFQQIVGVYSGRVGTKDAYDYQLGIVWKYQVVKDIVGSVAM
jgi:hypothetical protein